MNQLCSNDQVVISTEHYDRRLLSIYMPYDSVAHPEEKVEQFINYCRNKNYGLVIGCDANSHNEAWNSTDNNDRGEELLEYLIVEDIQICNIGTEPTFSDVGRGEVIDVTLSNTYMYDKITDWKVYTENLMSDHNIMNLA